MFHFPGFASSALWIQAGITGFSTRLGFPIRTSPDRSLVGGSPGLFAATRVLLRLLAPRHPPHALSSLQSQTSLCHHPRSFGIVCLEARPAPSSRLQPPSGHVQVQSSLDVRRGTLLFSDQGRSSRDPQSGFGPSCGHAPHSSFQGAAGFSLSMCFLSPSLLPGFWPGAARRRVRHQSKLILSFVFNFQ